MLRKFLSSFFFLILISFLNSSSLSYAKESHLILNIGDLTWLDCKPNENINETIEKFRKKYKIYMRSLEYTGQNAYVAGDLTPAMSWVLRINKNSQDRLISMEYGRFKESAGGVKIRTNRGVGFCSSIENVYIAYGAHPLIERKRDPAMKYVFLNYPFVLEETGQKGHLIFILHHKPGDSEDTAAVIRMKWIID